jgi:hypothetical protein
LKIRTQSTEGIDDPVVDYVEVSDWCTLGVLLIDVILRFWCQQSHQFCKNAWNWLDMVLLIFDAVMAILEHLIDIGDATVMPVLRSARIVRALRLYSVYRQIRRHK